MKKDLIETIQSKLRDLRDNTKCDENAETHCGCEKFDEIIDLVDNFRKIKDEVNWYRTYGEYLNTYHARIDAEACDYADQIGMNT